ncbi:MAG: PTS fructose transporter subunit IIC [Lactobacillus sp.]|uniref:PTS fructose transporter subunit IIC n=1 Tax=Lactobacillus panisapium TaxID=2012495 RepID=A0ABX8WB72_9LACO|nr:MULTISPECIES: PTS fructose transporter subunit IIC [Lactobacillus]MCO6547523.1 PTS fructose transporter subunit IIC [Gilliamella sp.]MCO6531198.1 PTS fructose transporter subunit IIC [Lactobacillus sp.]MCO6544109.1 PTS fructose transporter subunit IIC [Lactobacillus sp.]MCX8735753.1 PTS fructose transporter subunit IIC [Lactobacillus sp. B4026]QYN52411.1 PTS fructose transporter subunit IIC [Lactobacillus panisapium]
MDSIKKFFKELVDHFQTGVSYMIPLVSASGLMVSIAVIGGGNGVWNQTNNIWGILRMIGQQGLGFIPVMIAAYISYSIADRPGLAPAFIVGLVANKLGMGFIGGMVVGVLVGYLVYWLKKIPMPISLISLKSIFIIPLASVLISGLIIFYVFSNPVRGMQSGLTSWLASISGSNKVLVAAIIGAMMATDMGGPINKVAYTFSMASYTSGGYAISTACFIAIGIPPLIMALASFIGKKYYSQDEKENSTTALIMGIIATTEGAIPFAVSDPLAVIPSCMVGSGLASALNAFFGTTQKTALSTFMAAPFDSNILLYCVSIVIGVVVGALMCNLLKKLMHRDRKIATEAVTE